MSLTQELADELKSHVALNWNRRLMVAIRLLHRLAARTSIWQRFEAIMESVRVVDETFRVSMDRLDEWERETEPLITWEMVREIYGLPEDTPRIVPSSQVIDEWEKSVLAKIGHRLKQKLEQVEKLPL